MGLVELCASEDIQSWYPYRDLAEGEYARVDAEQIFTPYSAQELIFRQVAEFGCQTRECREKSVLLVSWRRVYSLTSSSHCH